ncbi:MAG: 2OG-Fe(II) oxygenase family protein [Lysobacterales bacterium]
MNNPLSEDLDQRPVAASSRVSGVPVIDLEPMIKGDGQQVVQQIGEAAKTWGFFQVVGHGMSPVQVEQVMDQAKSFFAQSDSVKELVRRSRDNPWGYNDQELTKNQKDAKAVFDFTVEGEDAIYGARNQWPAGLDQFRQVMMTYLETATRISLQLMEAFSIGAGLPRHSLRRLFEPVHTGFVRLNYYPVQAQGVVAQASQSPPELGIHHHTDAGALTVLLQDQVSGLQVYREGQWHGVKPLPGALVINTGDMMQVLSNDLYQAPVHRVAAMTARERFSMPFFLNMSANANIEPLHTLINEQRPSRYRAIPWSEFRRRRSDGDYADYGAEVQISDYRIN